MEGATIVLVMTVFNTRVRATVAQRRTGLAHLFFFSAILVLLISHLFQIYIWSAFLYYPGIEGNMHQSVLLAGSTYTTVGFANDTLPMRWQLLEVIMAVTGLFAWSTSIMYGLLQQLYRSED